MYYKKIIIILFVLLISGCSKYIKKEEIINSIIINKINLNEEIRVSSIKNYINGVVLFEEYGRPDINNSNTIIGAHSGMGSNAYFNSLEELEINDEISINYNNKIYKYSVEKIEIVDEKNLEPLNQKSYSILTLMTCKIGDSSKRVIIISKLISVI